jgi:hypothetical protein
VTDLLARVLANLRALGIDVGQLPKIPDELAEWIARLTHADLERIRQDAQELGRIGLLPTSSRDSQSP